MVGPRSQECHRARSSAYNNLNYVILQLPSGGTHSSSLMSSLNARSPLVTTQKNPYEWLHSQNIYAIPALDPSVIECSNRYIVLQESLYPILYTSNIVQWM
jgi:hypothetical protein